MRAKMENVVKKYIINWDTKREEGNGWIIGKIFEYWVTTGFWGQTSIIKRNQEIINIVI